MKSPIEVYSCKAHLYHSYVYACQSHREISTQACWLVNVLISPSQLAAFTAAITTGLSCHYGIGRRSYYVDYEHGKKALHYSFASQPLAVWAICWAKCSVAFMLVRIKRTPAWRVALYIAIAIQIGSAIAATVACLIQCQPMNAYWYVHIRS